jgi:hypothetical protein
MIIKRYETEFIKSDTLKKGDIFDEYEDLEDLVLNKYGQTRFVSFMLTLQHG